MRILNEATIKRYCKGYGYSYRCFGDIALITTGVDEWRLKAVKVVERGEVVDRILVEHINKAGNRKGKMKFHTQRYAYDLDYIFQNIISSHKSSHNSITNETFRIKELFAQI